MSTVSATAVATPARSGTSGAAVGAAVGAVPADPSAPASVPVPFGPGGPFAQGFGPGFGPGFGRGRGRRGGPFGRPGGWQQADLPSADDATDWFAGRLPSDWFVGAPSVSVDREEIIVVGELPAVEAGEGQSSAAAAEGRIARWREETRDERIAIAQEAESRYGRKVAWGATIGEHSDLFTHQAVPVMTRLRQPQRHGPRHPRRRRRRAVAVRGARLGGDPGRPARRRVALRPAQRHGRGRQAAVRGTAGLTLTASPDGAVPQLGCGAVCRRARLAVEHLG